MASRFATWGDINTRLTSMIASDAATPVYFTATERLAAGNDAQEIIARYAGCIEKDATFSTVVGTSSYAIATSIGSDVMEIRLVRYPDSAGVYDDPPLPGLTNEDDLAFYLDRASNGTPEKMYIDEINDKLYLLPKPDAVRTVKVKYIRRPTAMTVVGSAVDLPEEFQQSVLFYCMQHFYEMDEQYDKAGYWEKKFWQWIDKAEDKWRNRRAMKSGNIHIRPAGFRSRDTSSLS